MLIGFYDSDVGSDTESNVACECVAGSGTGGGDIQKWLSEAERIAGFRTYDVDDECEYEEIDWHSEGAPESLHE